MFRAVDAQSFGPCTDHGACDAPDGFGIFEWIAGVRLAGDDQLAT
jgi:hypothetical protein